MNDMANQGLRTLIFGMKELDSSLDVDKALAIEDLDQFENDISLLGVTGLEDTLQDDVA